MGKYIERLQPHIEFSFVCDKRKHIESPNGDIFYMLSAFAESSIYSISFAE